MPLELLLIKISFAFLYLWMCDDLMSLHPRFIEYDVMSVAILVSGAEHV